MLPSKEKRPRSKRLRQTLVAGFFWGVCGSVWSADRVILTLKNGDRVSGNLISETGDRIVVKSPVLGQLSVLKAELGRREDVAPAPVAPAAAPPRVAASTPVPAAAASTNFPGLGPTGWTPAWVRPFLTNWHGNVQLGMDLGFGTSDRQTFYLNAGATHTWNRLRNLADFHSVYGVVKQLSSANRLDGSLKTETDLDARRRFYAYNQGGAGFDAVRQLNREFHEGMGMGYKILQRPRFTLNSEGGFQYQSFDYLAAPDRSFVSLRLGENLSWKPMEKLSLNQRLTFTPNVENLNEYHVRFELGMSYPLFRRITLNVNLIDEFESQPPARVDRNDLQVQSTLGLNF